MKWLFSRIINGLFGNRIYEYEQKQFLIVLLAFYAGALSEKDRSFLPDKLLLDIDAMKFVREHEHEFLYFCDGTGEGEKYRRYYFKYLNHLIDVGVWKEAQ